MELPVLMGRIRTKEWMSITLAFIKGFRGEYGFANYFGLVFVYKNYAEIVSRHYLSKWQISHLLYQDVLIETFTKNIVEIFNWISKDYTQGMHL
jgi:hypothetical protein